MTYFLAEHPLFGTKNNRKSLGYQERSPYYWWWAYLRRNKDYLECCKREGKGKLARLYESFGDVRDDDFHKWWMNDQRGAKLFSEEPLITNLKRLANKSEWDEGWAKEDVMVIALPMSQSKKDLREHFARLLKKEHPRTRGRIKKPFINSTAKFKINRNFTIRSLKIALLVYDYFIEQTAIRGKIKLWEVGVELRLMRSMLPNEADTKKDTSYKRSVLAAAVKRYLNQAERTIANTALGTFP